eukprot:9485671-Pyramimonas_sp.AAC.1
MVKIRCTVRPSTVSLSARSSRRRRRRIRTARMRHGEHGQDAEDVHGGGHAEDPLQERFCSKQLHDIIRGEEEAYRDLPHAPPHGELLALVYRLAAVAPRAVRDVRLTHVEATRDDGHQAEELLPDIARPAVHPPQHVLAQAQDGHAQLLVP